MFIPKLDLSQIVSQLLSQFQLTENNCIWKRELQIALLLCLEAGSGLMAAQSGVLDARQKADGSWVTALDHFWGNHIFQALQSEFSGDEFVIEDTEIQSIPHARRRWLVDPLDSTSSFIKLGVDYGVMIGLVDDSRPVMGVTFKPGRGELCFAVLGAGAKICQISHTIHTSEASDTGHTQVKLECSNPETLLVRQGAGNDFVVSSHRSQKARNLLQSVFSDVQISSMPGSLKVIEVARGLRRAYYSPQGNHLGLWDLAAPSLILKEAGGVLSDLNGNTIAFRHPTHIINHGFLASNGFEHEQLLDILRNS